MAVDGDFANFRAVYDELTDEVQQASHQFLPDHVANWFAELKTFSSSNKHSRLCPLYPQKRTSVEHVGMSA